MRRTLLITLSMAVLALVIGGTYMWVGSSDAEAKEGPKNFTVVLAGTAVGVVREINGVENNCFDVGIFDPTTGRRIGDATDCLAFGSIVPIGDDGGFGIDNTTFFDLPGGTVVSLSRTTAQPVEDASFGPTHLTGEVGNEDNILSDMSTGRFAGATGNTVLRGAVDLSLLGDGIITFHCIFIIHVD